VFSVLVMKLVEHGVLDLDTPLQEYVSEPLWQNRGTSWHEDLSDLRADPRYRRTTARMSMSHTTGLPGWRWFEPDQKLRIHSEPGERFIYSGEGMTLLQVVIGNVTGKPLEELMQEHLFEPYGMSTSSYTWQPRFEADYAVGHAPDGKVYPKDKDNAARAPSTLETTTDDYARFMTAVLRGEGLSEASWNEIFKPQVGIRSRTMNHMDDIPQVDRLVNELNSSDPSGQRNADRFDEWITILRGKGRSDLYLVAGVPPSIRIHGIVQPLPEATLDGEEIEASVLPALPRHAAEQYRKTGCADASFRRASTGRFRINLHRERGRAAASIRALPLHLPQLGELDLPPGIEALTNLQRIGAHRWSHRVWEDDHSGRTGRCDQPEGCEAHHHDRRPDRIRAPPPA
jgi:Beta-lactamase